MKPLVAVLWREIVERRMVLLAALLLGLATVFLPLLPFMAQREDEELLEVLALVVAGAFGVCLLLVAGSGMLCRDWREQRLSFYLVRPISAWQLWFGKCAAVSLLVVSSMVLILLPAMLTGADFSRFSEFDYDLYLSPELGPWGLLEFSQDQATLQNRPGMHIFRSVGLGTLVALMALAVGISHGLGVFLRLGGGWSLVDAVAGGLFLWWLSVTSSRLAEVQASLTLDRILWLLIWLAVLWPLLVGWYQVSRGGVNRSRAHAMYSIVLWTGLGVFAFGVHGSVTRLLNSPPSTIEFVEQRWQAPVGPWSVISGPVVGNQDYQPVFAVNAETGSWQRLGSSNRWTSRPSFSPTGDYLVWTSSTREQKGLLHILDLTSHEARPVATGIYLGEAAWAWHPDGQRLVIAERSRISLLRANDAGTLASRQLRGEYFLPRIAVEKDRARLYLASTDAANPPWRRRIFEWYFDSGKLEPTGVSKALALEIDPLTHQTWTQLAPGTLTVIDERTGAEKYSMAFEGRMLSARALSDDGFLLLSINTGQTRLYRYSAAGELQVQRLLEGRCWLANRHSASEYWLGCRGAELVQEVLDSTEPLNSWFGDAVKRRALLVDIDSGEVVREEPGLIPFWQILPAASPARDWLIDGQGRAWLGMGGALEPV